jgi:hypothetical protein
MKAVLALAAVGSTQAMTLLTSTSYTTVADCTGAVTGVSYGGGSGGAADGICNSILGISSSKLDCAAKKYNVYVSKDCTGTAVAVDLDTCIAGTKMSCSSQPAYKVSLFNGTADATCASTPLMVIYGATSCSYATVPATISTSVKKDGTNYVQSVYSSKDCTGTAVSSVTYPAACTAFAQLPGFKATVADNAMTNAVSMVVAGAAAIFTLTQF